MRKSEREILDALRLSAPEAVRLMRQVQQRQQPAEQERRETLRVCYERLKGVSLHVLHPGGSRQAFRVLPCDLSSGGAGLLHGNFLYAGTRVLLEMPDRQDQEQRLAGRIAWCAHVQGRVHGVGIRFDDEIELSRFSDEAASLAAEATPPRLHGTVLYGDGDPASRDAVRRLLDALGVRMAAISRAGDVPLAARDLGPDVVMLDANLADDPVALVQRLVAADLAPPVLVVLDDAMTALEQPLTAVGAVTLRRPLDDVQLHGVLAGHLPVDAGEDEAGEQSQHDRDPALRALVHAFALRVEQEMQQIADLARNSESAMVARDHCVELMGKAGDYGFPLLSRTLRRLLIELHDPAQRAANLVRCQDLARRITSGATPLSHRNVRQCA